MAVEPNFVEILNINDSLNTIVQLFIVFVLAIYMVYAFLMLRQVRLLNRSFNTDASRLLSALAAGHLLATLFLFLFTIVVTIL